MKNTTTRQRDEMIAQSRRFAFVPATCHTVLFAYDGRKAERMLYDDAAAIVASATSRTVVRHTLHRVQRAETYVTDYYWSDGKRARVTERTAI